MRLSIRSFSFTSTLLLAIGAITLATSESASAHGSYATTWTSRYPTSTTLTNVTSGTGQSCALCHFSVSGGSNWNAYGWQMRQGTQAGQSVLNAIINAELQNSDTDPTGNTNLAEINANSQPGWTPGAANTEYFTSSTTPNLSAPASILGNLDPGAGAPTGYCYGDGSGTACPCANTSAVGSNTGCLSSLGVGGSLVATGTASISSDTLVLQGSGMPNSSALYYQGTAAQAGGAGAVFGDGLRCAAGSVIRLGTKANAAGVSQYPVAGDPAISVKGLDVVGSRRYYQCWYRNAAAFCTVSTFNVTNGVSLVWGS